MTIPAQTVLDEYLTAIRATDEYRRNLDADPDHARKWLRSEILRVFRATEFQDRDTFGYGQPMARPDGERISGHGIPGPDWVKGEGGPYIFVLDFLQYDRAYRGFGVQMSIHLDGSGYLWLGECNNSAAYTPETAVETWCLWRARRAVPADDALYAGPTYMGRTSVS